jgi:hypothetical protein
VSMKYTETSRLLARLGPQPLWIHYKCVPVWEDPDTLYVVAWEQIDAAQLEDLSLIFGKVVHQNSIASRDELMALIKAHAEDQPVSDLL